MAAVRAAWVCALVVAAVAGLSAGLVATRHGSGLNPDSYAYLATASNVVDHHSLTVPYDDDLFPYAPAVAARFNGYVPFTHWPPGYPILLATGGVVGIGLHASARVLDVLALMASAVLVAGIVLHLTRRPLVAGATGIAYAFAPAIAFGYSLALAEPEFIAFELAALLCLLLYLERRTPLRLAGVCVALAAAVLTRYIGLGLVPVALGVTLLARPVPVRTRIRDAVVVGVAGVGPLLVWSLITRAQGGAAIRTAGYYGMQRSELRMALNIITGWFDPFHASTWERLALLSIGALVVGIAARATTLVARRRETNGEHGRVTHGTAVLLAFMAAYSVVLVVTILFIDSFTTFESRQLLPLFAPALIVVVITVTDLFAQLRQPLIGIGVLAVVLVFVAWPPSERNAFRFSTGFYATKVPDNPFLRAVARLPKGALLITNTPGVISFSTSRPTIVVPIRRSIIDEKVNHNFERDIDQVGELMRTRCAFLLQGSSQFQGTRLATIGDIRSRVDLRERARFADGTIWESAEGATCARS